MICALLAQEFRDSAVVRCYENKTGIDKDLSQSD